MDQDFFSLQKSSESIRDMKTNSGYIQKFITNFQLYQIINFTIKYTFKASELLPDLIPRKR